MRMSKRIMSGILSCALVAGTISCETLGEMKVSGAEIVAGGYEIDMSDLPEVTFAEHPEWEELFAAAWETHKSNIKKAPTALNPNENSYYIDEAYNDYIYAWDTMFMMMFDRYGLHQFPTLSSLDNFYYHQVDSDGADDGFICREISETTGEFASWNNEYDDPKSLNPPLWAWAEWEQYQIHGDKSRFTKVINGKTIFERLISHFNFVERTRTMDNGLYGKTTGLANGFDNTPNQDYGDCTQTYNDLSIQQAQAALYISKIAVEIGDEETAEYFQKKHETLSRKINDLLWSEDDGFYFNLDGGGEFTNIATPTGLWAMAGNVATEERAETMIDRYTKNSEKMYRPNGLSTVTYDYVDKSNDNIRFWPMGNYWQGAVWAPASYQYIYGLKQYGYTDLAFDEAVRHITMISDVYQKGKNDEELGRATFWENYSSEYTVCARRQFDLEYARSNFCGWTGALAIGTMIEDILGLDLNAPENTITWNLQLAEANGIDKLYMCHDGVENRINLHMTERVSASAPAEITVTAKQDFKLIVNNGDINKIINVKAGTNTYHIDGEAKNAASMTVAVRPVVDDNNITAKELKQAKDYVTFTESKDKSYDDGIQNRIQKSGQIYNVNTIGYRADSTQNPIKLVNNNMFQKAGIDNAQSVKRSGYTEGEEGFMLMAPATNEMQTLKILIGIKDASATVKAAISDASSTNQSYVLTGTNQEQEYIVEIPYSAEKSGRNLLFEYVIEKGNTDGYITLKGAVLNDGGSPVEDAPKITVTSSDKSLTVNGVTEAEDVSWKIYIGTEKGIWDKVYETAELPYDINGLVNYKKYYIAASIVKDGVESSLSSVVTQIPEEVSRSARERAMIDLYDVISKILGENNGFDNLKYNLNFDVEGTYYGSQISFESNLFDRLYGITDEGVLKRPKQPMEDVIGTLTIASQYEGESVYLTKDVTIKAYASGEVSEVVGTLADVTDSTIDLTKEGTKDWIQFCDAEITNAARKREDSLITNIKRINNGSVDRATDSPICFTATDSSVNEPINQCVMTHRIDDGEDGAGFTFDVPYSDTDQILSVYALAYDSQVTFEFLINEKIYYKETISKLNASVIGKFSVQYRTISQEDQCSVRVTMTENYVSNYWGGSVGLAAVTLRETDNEIELPVDTYDDTLQISYDGEVPANVSLTEEGVKDWYLFSSNEDKTAAHNEKLNVDGIKDIVFDYENQDYKLEYVPTNNEYKTNYSYTDGTVISSESGKKPSVVVKGDGHSMEFTLPGSKNHQQARIYSGAWNSKAIMEVCVGDKTVSAYGSAGSSVTYGVYTIDYCSEEDLKVKIYNATTEEWGNFSVSAITLKEWYTIEKKTNEGGNVDVGLYEALPGTVVDVYPITENGYSLKENDLTVSAGNSKSTVQNGYFVMPAHNVIVQAVFTKEEFLLGDFNGDNTITAIDAYIALSLSNPTEEQLKRGDMNHDGVLDKRDVQLILDIASGAANEVQIHN